MRIRPGEAVLGFVLALSSVQLDAQAAVPTLTAVIVTPSPAIARSPVTITVSGAPTGSCTVTVTFGDGSSRTVTTAVPFALKHTYTKTGTFTVAAFAPNCAGAPVAALTVNTETTGPFALRRLELRFANGRGEITVPRDSPKLKAYADILFNGSGLLTAAWEVDGRTLAIIHEYLTFGSRKVIESPDTPEFPTFEPGLHRITFRVISPVPGFTVPTINYYVEGRPAAPAPIELISPPDGTTLPQSPVAFRWKPTSQAASYQVEIYEEGKKEPIFKALTREPTYTLPEHNTQIFAIGRGYSWQVKGLDKDGNQIAQSETRRFTWQPEPGAGTFVPRQLLAGLRLAPRATIDPVLAELEGRHGLRRLDVYDLRSIDTTLVLFEIVRPQTVQSIVAALSADARVLFAQPNFLHAATAARNDPLAGLQSGLSLIGAPSVHHRVSGKGVRVAIIDTGVEAAHPDLAGRIVERANFIEGDGSMDVHGTVIAGIIGATADNGLGIYGIAPQAELVAIRSCRPKFAGQAEAICTAQALAKGLDFAISTGAKVVNMSIGGPKDILIPKLIDRAVSLGIVVVAAVGNRGPKGEPVYPAALSNVIAVTAVDAKNQLYPYASHGDYIDVAAPGVNILSTSGGGVYSTFSGTSVATAHVSGAAALLLEARPALDPRALQKILETTALDVGPPGKDPQFGSGSINVCRALAELVGEKLACQ